MHLRGRLRLTRSAPQTSCSRACLRAACEPDVPCGTPYWIRGLRGRREKSRADAEWDDDEVTADLSCPAGKQHLCTSTSRETFPQSVADITMVMKAKAMLVTSEHVIYKYHIFLHLGGKSRPSLRTVPPPPVQLENNKTYYAAPETETMPELSSASPHAPTAFAPAQRAGIPRVVRYTCEVCGIEFDRPSLLSTHARSHDVACGRVHTCPVPGCPKAFLTPSNLKRHLRTHHAEGRPQAHASEQSGTAPAEGSAGGIAEGDGSGSGTLS